MSRVTALQEWRKLRPPERDLATRFAEVYGRECRLKARRIKDAAGWLKGRCWEGYAARYADDRRPPPKAERVFIRQGSPEWDAWTAYYRSLGKLGPVGLSAVWNTDQRAPGRFEDTLWPPDWARRGDVIDATWSEVDQQFALEGPA